MRNRAAAPPDGVGMTDLERLKAELERQDRELAVCFEQMRGLDPDLVISVSPEWMGDLSADPDPEPVPVPAAWALRA